MAPYRLGRSYHARPLDNHYDIDLLGAHVHFPGHERVLPAARPAAAQIEGESNADRRGRNVAAQAEKVRRLGLLAENAGMFEYEHTAIDKRWMTREYYHDPDEDSVVRKRQAWLSRDAAVKELRKNQQKTFELHRRMRWLRGTIGGCAKQWDANRESTDPLLDLYRDWGPNAKWHVDCGSSGTTDHFDPIIDEVHLSFEFNYEDRTHIFRFFDGRYDRREKTHQRSLWERFANQTTDQRRYYAIDITWLASFDDIRDHCYTVYLTNDGKDYQWRSIADILLEPTDPHHYTDHIFGAYQSFTLLNTNQGRYISYFLYKSVSQAGLEGGSLVERWLWPRTLYAEAYFLKKLRRLILSGRTDPRHRLMNARECFTAAQHPSDFDELKRLKVPSDRNWATEPKSKMDPRIPINRDAAKRGAVKAAVNVKKGAVVGYRLAKFLGKIAVTWKVPE